MKIKAGVGMADVGMQVTVLGPVGVRREGDDTELGERLQRLLAALVVSRGSVVSVERLADIVWDGDRPDRSGGTLRSYVTRLRRTLGAERSDVVAFRQPGYVIDLLPGELDSDEFEQHLDQALTYLRVADPGAAIPLLTSAIDTWHGHAYAMFADEDWARPEAVRLEERLIAAREALVDARLGVGASEQAVADAQALVEAEPLRDRPRSLLMRALYATGRQAESLRVATEYRRYLVDEVGLDPSEEIVDLEGRIAQGGVVDSSMRALRGYELHERIGEGAFAVVHRATQPGLQREVAVKIIRGELADRADFIRRFEVEAQTVARVEHPNVVPLFDFWREPGAAYLVMRLLRGGSVEQALRARGPYSRDQALQLLDEVGAALESAHRAGVVHRDVRPANLLLDDDGVTYLTDFGIALPTAASDDLPIVSPAHAAPEVLRGEAAGASADVLSLGVTVFELLTGRLPFADSLDRAEVIRRQLTEPLPPVRATRTDLPAGVDDVLARATSKAAADRHGSVAALVDDLRVALDRDPNHSPTGLVASARHPAENPYVGLHAFDEQDADRYFGHEDLVVELVDALERHPMVTVVGASGSGKSSVVRAGLLPAVRRGAVPGSESWFVTTMLPGLEPLDALEAALLRIAVNPPATLRDQLAQSGGLLRAIRRVLPDDRSRVLLVIDQFEELFTQVGDREERDRFLTEVAAAITAPDSPLCVVATLRADHYDAPLRHPAVAQLVTDGTVTVRPLTPDALERAISLPARSVGVDVEPALVVDLVAAVTAHPAMLPLLQFSLTELFERRVADVMLRETHEQLGGLTGALAARADRIVDEGDNRDEDAIRRIFGRLVSLGEGTEDTRRRVLRSELGDGERSAWLVDAFVVARLLATDRDPATRSPTVEVAHEALLRDWPRLRYWLDEDRADLRTLRQITVYSNAWIADGRDAGELARGGRLDAALGIATRHDDWLNDDEREWITASTAATEAEVARQHEAIAHDRRQNRRLRQLLTTAVVLLVVAAVAAAGALTLRNRAVNSEREASTARDDALDSAEAAALNAEQARAAESAAATNAEQAQAAEADAEANAAIADDERQAAVHQRGLFEGRTWMASGTAVVDEDPELALMLALNASERLGDDVQATAVLRETLAESRTILYHGPVNGSAQSGENFSGDISPDGTRIAIGTDRGDVMVRDVDSGETLWATSIGSDTATVAVTTPSFVTGATELAVTVWYVGGNEAIPRPGAGVHILDALTGELLRSYGHAGCGWRRVPSEPTLGTLMLVYSNDLEWERENLCGPADAEFNRNGQLQWFDVQTGETTLIGPVFSETSTATVQVSQAASTDRLLIAQPLASADGPAGRVARVEDTSSGEVLMEIEVDDTGDIALSPDGEAVVTGGTHGVSNGSIRVVDVATGEIRSLVGHPGAIVTNISFIAEGEQFVSVDLNGVMKIWQLDDGALIATIRTGDAEVRQSALSVDARRAALFSTGHVVVVALDPEDVAEVGVIHTCDGDPDFNVTLGLVVRDDRLLTRTICAEDLEARPNFYVSRNEVFDLASGSRLAVFGLADGQSGDMSPDGRIIADQLAIEPSDTSPAGMTGTLVLTEIDTGDKEAMGGLCAANLDRAEYDAECREPPDEPYAGYSSEVRFSPDGRMVVMGTGRGGPGRVWDVATGQTLAAWPFVYFALSPDGSRLATTSHRDLLLEVRDTDSFEIVASRQLRAEEQITGLDFGGSGTIIGTIENGVVFYDSDSLEPVGDPIENAHESFIRQLVVSDDGSMFATAGNDGYARVWSLESKELLNEILVDPADRVQSVAFANDDTRLLATTPTSPVRIYNLVTAELLDVARRRLVREFTPEECDRYFAETACPALAEMSTAPTNA